MATSIADRRVGHPGERAAQPYWNPYLAGFGLGLVLLAAYLVAGRGPGATGAFSSVAAWIANALSPEHAQASAVHARYLYTANGKLGQAHITYIYYTVDMGKYECPDRQKAVNIPYEINEIDL